MLVRALNMLDYCGVATIGMGIATAALDQPGDEGCAYARGRPHWQRRNRRLATRSRTRAAARAGSGFDALSRRQHHHHLTALEAGILFDLGVIGDIGLHLVEQFGA